MVQYRYKILILFIFEKHICLKFYTKYQIANGFKRTDSVNHRPKPSNKVEDHLYKYGGDFRHVNETSSGKRGLNIIKSALQQGGMQTFFLSLNTLFKTFV